MSSNDKIRLFENKRIRAAWDEEREEWYFSIVDVCEVLSGTENPRRYWSDLKRKLKAEGAAEVYEKIVQLKMTAPDGKNELPMLLIPNSFFASSGLFHPPRLSRSNSGWHRLAENRSKKPLIRK